MEIEDYARARDVAEAVFYSLSHRSRFRECASLFAIETNESGLNHYFQSIRANCLVHQGDFQTAESLARQTLAACAPKTLASAHCRHALAGMAHARGEFELAGVDYEAALAQRTDLQDLIGSYYSAMSLAWLELQRDNIAGARQRVSQSYQLCQRIGHLGGMLPVHVCAGDIAMREGRTDDALESYRQALGIEDSVRHPQHRASTLVKLGSIYLKRGQLDLAQDRLEEALELAELVGDVRIAVNGRLALARALKAKGDADTAKAELQRALAHAQGLDTGGQVSAILIELARISLAGGDRALAARIAGALRSRDLSTLEEEWGSLMAEMPADSDLAATADIDDLVLELVNESKFGLLRL